MSHTAGVHNEQPCTFTYKLTVIVISCICLLCTYMQAKDYRTFAKYKYFKSIMYAHNYIQFSITCSLCHLEEVSDSWINLTIASL